LIKNNNYSIPFITINHLYDDKAELGYSVIGGKIINHLYDDKVVPNSIEKYRKIINHLYYDD